MLLSSSRAGRWPLTFSVAALAALTACSDEPVGPTRLPTAKPVVLTGGPPVQLVVTNRSGGTEVGSIQWAASQIPTSDGGHITFDPRLAGETIELDAELSLQYKAIIEAPVNGGITLSGKDQHRVIRAPAGVELRNVTVTKGNSASGSAIHSGMALVLKHSTVRDNRGPGPVVKADGWGATLENSTISRNVGTAAFEYDDDTRVLVNHSTIAFNTGAGLSYVAGPDPFTRVQLFNSILANNGKNCTDYWHYEYFGTNISSDWSCGEVHIVVADPQLMPLADNGGPTMTHAIPHTSRAFNGSTDCYPMTDQRYVPRDAKCDVGAFEFNDFTKVTITIDQSVKVSSSTGKAMLTGTITCTRADTFSLLLELHQDQKIGGQIIDVHSVSQLPVACTTTAKTWSVPMNLLPGEAFQAGAARAIAKTFDTAEWVTPAEAERGVKISFSRK
jgi:hypothetical protein